MIGGFSFEARNQRCFYTSAFKFSVLCYICKSAKPPSVIGVVFVWKMKLWTRTLVIGRRLWLVTTHCMYLF